jgi:hypothetical protein
MLTSPFIPFQLLDGTTIVERQSHQGIGATLDIGKTNTLCK